MVFYSYVYDSKFIGGVDAVTEAPTGSMAVSLRIHGGPDALGVPLHDFSSNSNACGPCPSAGDAVQHADATRYPEASYNDLRLQLAAFHAVDAQRIVLAASASEFIFRVTAWVAQQGGKAVWLPPHSYGDYAAAASAHRLALTADVAQADLFWACEPSSPLGQAQPGFAAPVARVEPIEPIAPIKRPPAIGVLDRAYEPLRLSGAPSLSAAQLSRVWQLFTPNKALGFTGIRAAYAIAPLGDEVAIEKLNQLCPSWSIGAHGVAMLQAWVQTEAQSWLADSLEVLRGWKERQIAALESLGWVCLPSEANFFCAKPALPPGQDLPHLLAALRGRGIKLRDTASFGVPGHVRVSVQAPKVQDVLRQASTDIFQGKNDF